MADAHGSGPCVRKDVGVQLPPCPPIKHGFPGLFWSPGVQRADVVRDFKQAWEAKDIDALIGLVEPDATAIGDGGGLVSAELRPVEGGEQIARHYVDLAGRGADMTLLERTVNGQRGLVAQHDGVTMTVMAFDIVGGQIKHIWAVLNPEKLRPWTTD